MKDKHLFLECADRLELQPVEHSMSVATWLRRLANSLPEPCTCHERDSSYTCDVCKQEGAWGHMEDTRSSSRWIEYFGEEVIDPDGWRRDNLSMDTPIHITDFAKRWAASTCKQPPHPWLEAVLRNS